ncbi:hypothetical protein [Dyadobacter sp. CY326]|uniref:hypothetical protein n=1 Tax=Dyadobacter sp. CY326 TaxID=2907300 RepID=UPI001F1C6991|nr:hypothetical protein [Dyadobacter sp. CY326]MCE7064894.1 hypothetical protein [Dyadobacter sp. CY326]
MFADGIQAMAAYGYRKDRTLSEILFCSASYQKSYGTLDASWFFNLYELAMTVVTHTDGKSTSSYPVEWFNEFADVYPREALKFLISETLENNGARWHQEEQFIDMLEKFQSTYSPTNWYLLCRSLPLASSEVILRHGLAILDLVEDGLRENFKMWLDTIPSKHIKEAENDFSAGVVKEFELRLGRSLQLKSGKNDLEDNQPTRGLAIAFPLSNASLDEVSAHLELHPLKADQRADFEGYVYKLRNDDDKKRIIRLAAAAFKYGRDAPEWMSNVFVKGSEEWMRLNISLFVNLTDGWYHSLHYTDYLKNAYQVDGQRAISILHEELSFLLSDKNYDFSDLISCNLIKAFSELGLSEKVVGELIRQVYALVERRLPHPPNAKINASIYGGLESFTDDELVVALLIARLKTFTTEKTQGIIWSLSYIARTRPHLLFRPYQWAFLQEKLLLPIHKAILLQVLHDYIDSDKIPDYFVELLLRRYPTDYFLENQIIKSFFEFEPISIDKPRIRLTYPSHAYDRGFMEYIHPKYRILSKYLGVLHGSFRAYEHKRDIISEEFGQYYMRSEKLMTPIVPLANAPYEIINNLWCEELTNISRNTYPPDTLGLDLYLPELIIQIGTLCKRPPYLPKSEEIPEYGTFDASAPVERDGWVVLAWKEVEIYGDDFKSKGRRTISSHLTFGGKPVKGQFRFAKYLFRASYYREAVITKAQSDEPICELNIIDKLEYCNLLFVSPWIISQLGLEVAQDFHNGFQAVDNTGEVIVRLMTWREQYFGGISDCTEVPRLEGTAVVLKATWYDRLKSIYGNKTAWFVQSKSELEDV